MNTLDLLHQLPGPKNLASRSLLRVLLRHYHNSVCTICDFYPKYSVMIVKGPFYEHLNDIMKGKFDPSVLNILVSQGVIEVSEITRMKHRITFVQQEATA